MEQQPTKETDPATDLQFDRAEFDDAESALGGLGCTACNKPIADAYFEINGAIVCDACRAEAAALRTGGSGLARCFRATLFGILAGALGAGIYYGIVALTGFEIGLVAILVGFMVGFAVHVGSRARGGWLYQLLAVTLTYGSIVSAYVPDVAEGLRQATLEPSAATMDGTSEPAAVANADPVGAFVEDVDPAEVSTPEPAELEAVVAANPDVGEVDSAEIGLAPQAALDEPLEVSPLFFWTVVSVIALAAPFLMGFDNILGLLIIGFGLWQAGKMNRKQPFEVAGPFQVSGAAGEHG